MMRHMRTGFIRGLRCVPAASGRHRGHAKIGPKCPSTGFPLRSSRWSAGAPRLPAALLASMQHDTVHFA
eukprot:1225933-Alexandrium_andersonii.AAC.1